VRLHISRSANRHGHRDQSYMTVVESRRVGSIKGSGNGMLDLDLG
jgi:hypothetical protein